MQRGKLSGAVAIVGFVALLGGCATGNDERAGGERTSTISTDCIWIRQAQDFRVLDDHNLVVFAPRSRPYHVELSRSCQGLRFEHSIGLSSRNDRFCGFAGDAVLVRGGLPDRCPVVSVRRLDRADYDTLIGRFEERVPDDLGDEASGEIVIDIPRAED